LGGRTGKNRGKKRHEEVSGKKKFEKIRGKKEPHEKQEGKNEARVA